MLGWEFPPFNAGGLGTACYGLTKALSSLNVEITFVIPKAPCDFSHDFLRIINADIEYKHLTNLYWVKSNLVPYHETYDPRKKVFKHKNRNLDKFKLYGENTFQEVEFFAKRVLEIPNLNEYDVIHGHDWMTYPAAISLKTKTGKPLILHIHATEFDRGIIGINQKVYEIEKQGFENADLIVAVSNFTKKTVVEKYGISPEKIRVVHNGVLFEKIKEDYDVKIFPGDKVVLFLGRITIQKGPLYFIEAAKLVAEQIENVKFVVTGEGDLLPEMIEKSAEYGLSDKIVFTGFLRGKELKRMYRLADVYVMPSVSEPFGITPLESMSLGTPVIISKQSGVSEVIRNCLKVDFWDVRKLANHIVSVLRYNELRDCLKEHGYEEVSNINWDKSAEKMLNIYHEVINNN